MNQTALYFSSQSKPFNEVLKEVQAYLSSKYATLLSRHPAEQKQQIIAYISQYLTDHRLHVSSLSLDELIDRLYAEMVEYSFLTRYLFASDVEEININGYNDVKISYTNGSILPADEQFSSPEHAVNVIRRLLHQSGMILDYSQPIVRGHLANNIRITVFGAPVTDKDKGIAASIRIVNPLKLAREDFIRSGTATGEMLDFLSQCLRYGLSICVTGATGSGKTTLMSWLLSTIPFDKRIFTIENGTREFDLVMTDETGNVLNNVVHTVTRSSEDARQNIDQEKLLEFALTANPDVICVGEMKSAEAFAAQEAARTGHTVITTTHANSCLATYYRMVTLCTQKYEMNDRTLFNLVTEAFPIVLFVKKLEDNVRRIMEITECRIQLDGTREVVPLYRFAVRSTREVGGQIRIEGDYEKVNDISPGLQKRLLENGLPLSLLQRLQKGGDST
ncbi:CpaF family protein [Xylanibacillus composti]|uniref:Type II secretion system protein E n=1 Tax=Xylanibacillus composti TaxID=1572762 RepID=A0A8J4H010_9BACL|nr:CpaF/VirB11 family protein [Xylanibacillus composti]MDT9723620.1 CpaF family protein [Xylanibacillus composti]GIQ68339.1 type II secretion system protein E [Xylanibacillus composti]